ncbi:MAG: VOC family protein [Helicobacteraceae bacterium]|jgi:hypothetical protein|nr:VOC family protein [Helicobacteraceae bacterium]
MIDLKFHHIGVATKSIEREFSVFEALGYRKVSETFIDEEQRIRGLFIEGRRGAPALELLEDLDERGPLAAILKNHIKFYHFAYETDNIESDSRKIISSLKAIMIVPIVNATYFEKICFLALRNQALIELVQLKGS